MSLKPWMVGCAAAICLIVTVVMILGLPMSTRGHYGPQGFAYPDGTRDFDTDGGVVTGAAAARVVDERLRLAEDRVLRTTAAFLLPDLNPGHRIEQFEMRFDVALFSVQPRPSDGFAVTFGALPTGDTVPERGFIDSPGLSIRFDAFDSLGDPSSIDVIVGGRVLASKPVSFTTRSFSPRPVVIHWDARGLDLDYGGEPVFQDVGTGPFAARPGYRFAFTATAGFTGIEVSLDNLSIRTTEFVPTPRGSIVLSEILPLPEPQHRASGTGEWIELYNGTGRPVNLGGWRLTLSTHHSSDPAGSSIDWAFPNVRMAPFEYRLVFASGRDRQEPALPLHTNFTLPDDGGALSLIDHQGVEVSRFTFGPASPGAAFGWVDVLGKTGYLPTATPGAPNRGHPMPHAAPPGVTIRHPGGVIDGPVAVTIDGPDLPAGGVIRYALGSAAPTERSRVYDGPLEIARTTTLRAAAFAPGHLPGPVATRAFVFLAPEVRRFRSNLPVVVVDSAGQDIDQDCSPFTRRRYRTVHTAIFGDPNGNTRLDQAPTVTTLGSMRVRGQSSALEFPKKQYNWRIRGDADTPHALPILGMPAHTDWVLAAPYSDKTLMRNVLAYETGRALLGPGGGPRTRFVELFFNQDGDDVTMADYRGVYVVTEKIGPGPDRIPVGPEGYIFKLDKGLDWDATVTSGVHHLRVGFVHPKDPSPAQQNELTKILTDFERALGSEQFADPQRGYAAHMDVASFLDQNWIDEIFREVDAWWMSSYFYRERGGRIRAKPLWDFNLSLGNATDVSGYAAQGWYRDVHLGGRHPWFHRPFDDPAFRDRYWDRYQELRRTWFATGRLRRWIHGLADRLETAAGRNFERWPILGRKTWPEVPGYETRTTYRQEVDHMVDWLTRRLAWIDSQFVGRPVVDRRADGIHLALPAGTRGTIYFTTDGSDPGRPPRPEWTTLLDGSRSRAEVLIPTDSNGGDRLSVAQWTTPDPPPNARRWQQVDEGAVGFEHKSTEYAAFIRHHVPEMYGRHTSCFIRFPFQIDDLDSLQRSSAIRLRIRCDDGFVGYLNGTRIGAKNAPPELDYRASATRTTDDRNAVLWADYDLSRYRDVLRRGRNVLAIHGLNDRPNSTDALWNVELSYVDPRSVAPPPQARRYQGPLPAQGTTPIRAAVFDGKLWSGTVTISRH